MFELMVKIGPAASLFLIGGWTPDATYVVSNLVRQVIIEDAFAPKVEPELST